MRLKLYKIQGNSDCEPLKPIAVTIRFGFDLISKSCRSTGSWPRSIGLNERVRSSRCAAAATARRYFRATATMGPWGLVFYQVLREERFATNAESVQLSGGRERQCRIGCHLGGALKMTDMKNTDLKLTEHIAGHEIAGYEIAGHENARHKIARHLLFCA